MKIKNGILISFSVFSIVLCLLKPFKRSNDDISKVFNDAKSKMSILKNTACKELRDINGNDSGLVCVQQIDHPRLKITRFLNFMPDYAKNEVKCYSYENINCCPKNVKCVNSICNKHYSTLDAENFANTIALLVVEKK